ncbi:hypothetical protein ACQQ2Q_22325 [Agrobacterium sp. ES01]|uniref:hypothetical protein n=1 Tax=Agrobacterium sp. ES01 TaxID=3420714 RepID=UPI003D0B630F
MDWGSVPDWISAVGDAVMGGAAGFAAYQGYKGLTAWRTEMVGRRRMELAEEVLADFYEARDVLRWVRSPMAYSHESETRPGRDVDPEDLRGHRDTFYVPLKRLSDNAEFFSRIRARRYRVIAAFGVEAAKPYDVIHEINNRIAVSARMLMQLDPRNTNDRNVSRQERLEADVWEGLEENDQIGNRINETLKTVEDRFRPEIVGTGSRTAP